MARQRSNPVNRHWSGFSVNALALSAGAVGSTAAAAQHDRETILRTRGSLLSWFDATPDSGDIVQVSAGLILVPEGTGTTVLWSPFTDADAPWFYYTTFFLGYDEPVVDVIDIPGASSYRETVDSKGMRRVRNQEMQFVVENTTIGSAEAINVVMGGRILSQE